MLTTRKTIVFLALAFLIPLERMQCAGVLPEPMLGSQVDALFKQSLKKRETEQGRAYQDRFLKAIEPKLLPAFAACTKKDVNTVEPGSVAFVIGADGHVKRLIWSEDVPLAQCVAQKFRSITNLPPPPEDNWFDGVAVAYHSQAGKNAPVDKPLKTTVKHLSEIDKVTAPYVAKARATYPAAKARFLHGLPLGYSFSVRARLFDPDGKRKDSLIKVTKISGSRITGILLQADLLTTYKKGQTITVNESDIDNWVIQRPDGTEEGNYVGKFMDHYKPQ
jgi:hypothetical protein